MITRCPSCATMFKVVPDQLRISEGWVRCGHCGDVFDARLYLQDPGPPAAPSSPAAPVGAQGPEKSNPAHTGAPAAFARRQPVPTGVPPVPIQASAPLAGDDLDGRGGEPPVSSPALARVAPTGDSRAGAQLAREPVDAGGDDDEAAAALSFVRQARRRAFWRRGSVRFALFSASLLLGVALAVQVAIQERDRWVAQWPGARPAMTLLCSALGCTIRPWQRIESVVIDASAFNRIRADIYRLTVGVRNVSTHAVAAPALELTLTDLQDRAVVRKVLDPAQLGWGAELLASAEISASLTLVVDPPAGATIGGYRVVVFYP